MDEYAEEKRTEKNLIVRSGISEAETTKIKDCVRRFVLKLYRHEASRGLFATAQLLVGKQHQHTFKNDINFLYHFTFTYLICFK